MASDTQVLKYGIRPRIFAAAALLGFVAAVGYAGREGYRAATDSFVAPIILSPDNDVVLANKAKMAELRVERARLVAEVDAVEADLAVSDRAIGQLRALIATASNALSWTKDATREQAVASIVDLKTLARQKVVLAEMTERQERLTRAASTNLAGSLISESEQVKEQLTLNQMQLALLDNERTRAQSELALRQLSTAQRSLDSGGAPLMPEAVAREEQRVRIELEILRVECEQRSKRTLRALMTEKLASMDAIERELRARPLFRAAAATLEIAFVPYTQIDGVTAGANVYECVWGIFQCKPVGKIAEIIPGEVVLPDPWGNQARGQYAILDLQTHRSARSKVLRVRPGDVPVPAPVERNAVSER